MNSSLPLSVALALCANPAAGAASHPFSVHDMLAMQRISEFRVSPDGKRVVFTLRTTDLEENKGKTSLWLVQTDGSGLRRLTAAQANDNDPRWSADGMALSFFPLDRERRRCGALPSMAARPNRSRTCRWTRRISFFRQMAGTWR